MSHHHKKEWWEYHRANPHIYALFDQLTKKALDAGRTHYSSRAIIEVIRWNYNIVTKSNDDFKINDHYTAYYARYFMHLNPMHEGFFHLRELKGIQDDD